jgi:hypothetical protein
VGGFGIDDDGDIFFDHCVLGSACTRNQLHSSISNVTYSADQLDDEIVARWGGRRAVEPPSPDGKSLRRDDPTRRVTQAPRQAGPGDGKAVFFLFGYSIEAPRDQEWLRMELDELADDFEVLRNAGYRVVIDPQATSSDFLEAVAEKGEGAEGMPVAAIYWSGHGNPDGSLATCDGGTVRPGDVDAATASAALRLVVLSSCYVGGRARSWRQALGGRPLVVGWGRPVSIDRALDFLRPDDRTLTDLDDLIARYLLNDTPIPSDEKGLSYSPAGSIALKGRVGDVPARMKTVCAMLGASMEVADTHVKLLVPLDDGRSQRVRVAIVDSGLPFGEGEPLLAAESDVGELTAVVEARALLDGVLPASYARFATVQGEAEAPTIVAQGFLPLARVRDQDLAALLFQVCQQADALEHSVFGTNR